MQTLPAFLAAPTKRFEKPSRHHGKHEHSQYVRNRCTANQSNMGSEES